MGERRQHAEVGRHQADRLSEALAVFVKPYVGLPWLRQPQQDSAVAEQVEREGEVVVRLADAVNLSFLSYDLTKRSDACVIL